MHRSEFNYLWLTMAKRARLVVACEQDQTRMDDLQPKQKATYAANCGLTNKLMRHSGLLFKTKEYHSRSNKGGLVLRGEDVHS